MCRLKHVSFLYWYRKGRKKSSEKVGEGLTFPSPNPNFSPPFHHQQRSMFNLKESIQRVLFSLKMVSCFAWKFSDRVGCYGNFPSNELGRFRDEIQWFSRDFWGEMKRMVEKCAQIAFKRGDRFFAIEHYGNCYGAKDFSSGSQPEEYRCRYGVGLENVFYVYKVSMWFGVYPNDLYG